MYKVYKIPFFAALALSLSMWLYALYPQSPNASSTHLEGEVLNAYAETPVVNSQKKVGDFVPTVPMELIKAAEADKTGNLPYQLAYVYRDGYKGVQINPVLAAKWLDLAIEREHPAAMYDRAMELKDTFNFVEREDALSLMARAAKKDFARAQLELGNAYYEGVLLDQDFGAAVYWYQKAAAKNSSDANYALGVMYYAGSGVELSAEKAMHYFKLAADDGHAIAQFYLAMGYYSGMGVKQDYMIAHDLLNKAVVGGNLDALYALKRMGIT